MIYFVILKITLSNLALSAGSISPHILPRILATSPMLASGFSFLTFIIIIIVRWRSFEFRWRSDNHRGPGCIHEEEVGAHRSLWRIWVLRKRSSLSFSSQFQVGSLLCLFFLSFHLHHFLPPSSSSASSPPPSLDDLASPGNKKTLKHIFLNELDWYDCVECWYFDT